VYNDEAERHPPAKGGFCKAKVLKRKTKAFEKHKKRRIQQ
jgi:hypothetical protein